MTARDAPLSLSLKLIFGVGACGEVIFLGMFNTFIGIFYNQAIGLSNALIGTAVMLALLGDAISDPIAGALSDRWRSRLGRRHPFLFVAPAPLAISLYCIFNPPFAWTSAADPSGVADQTALFAWLVFWTVSGRLFLTLYTIPHLALGGELTKNAHERSQLFSLNATWGYAIGALFAFVAWSVFLSGEAVNAQGVTIPGHLDPASYRPLIFTACGVVLVTIWLCAFGTLRRAQTLSIVSEENAKLTPRRLFGDFLSVLRNRNYRSLMIGFFFLMISVGLHETYNVFVATYFWEFTPKEIRWIAVAVIPAVVAGALAAPILMRRFDRRPVLIFALSALAVFVQLPIDLRLLGLFPDNESALTLPLVIVGAVGVVMTTAIGAVAVLSMLGDIADEHDLATGRRQEGVIYSARAFFAKASNSFGHFIAGVALDLFVRLPFDSAPGHVDADVVTRLGIAAGPTMGVAAVLAIVFYARYNLPRERHDQIVEQLRRRAIAAEQST